jgi:large subunit ribosomal protein L33
MAKAKGKVIALKLLSTAGTGFFYVTTKNVRNVPTKLTLKKYDPVVRKHVLFTEGKMK